MADVKQPVPQEFRGERTYRLKQPHYRLGRLYQPGEIITVTDEVPGRTWVPFNPKAEAEAAARSRLEASKAPTGRPSDESP